jgi:hypothetical protein
MNSPLRVTTSRLRLFTPMGAIALALVWLLGPQATPCDAQNQLRKRFTFKIDSQTPLKDLLPLAPDAATPLSSWLVQDLTQVPQVLLQKPEVINREVRPEPKSAPSELLDPRKPGATVDDLFRESNDGSGIFPGSTEAKKAAFLRELQQQEKAIEKTAHGIAKINHLNQKGPDHFLKVLLENRIDLAGLPFVMGDACRQTVPRGRAFLNGVNLVESALPLEAKIQLFNVDNASVAKSFWNKYEMVRHPPGRAPAPNQKSDPLEENRERIAALMQVLVPQHAEMRKGLVKHLADFDQVDATRALARLAVFSFEKEVRQAAVAALKKRATEDCSDILLEGLRYPWPAIANNASDAIAQLELRPLVSQLIALLDDADPRAPVQAVVNGKKTLLVREVVRLNHHRNCLLCHPPGNTPDVQLDLLGRSTEIVTGAVPIPSQRFPLSYFNGSPDIVVRADVTYLRQDFSLMQPVENAAPWPVNQRFDFLVRTRAVTSEDAAAYQKWAQRQGPGYLAPHRQAALAALRSLTGRDAEPTAKAWQLVLAE